MSNLGPQEIVILGVLAAFLGFEIAMFLDMLRNDSLSPTAKLWWAAAMLIIHPFAALYYYFTAHRNM
jgi:hypothetical protein